MFHDIETNCLILFCLYLYNPSFSHAGNQCVLKRTSKFCFTRVVLRRNMARCSLWFSLWWMQGNFSWHTVNKSWINAYIQKVLVDNMHYYETCDAYCQTIDCVCIGAWDDSDDTCAQGKYYNCAHDFGSYTHDAICECNPHPDTMVCIGSGTPPPGKKTEIWYETNADIKHLWWVNMARCRPRLCLWWLQGSSFPHGHYLLNLW